MRRYIPPKERNFFSRASQKTRVSFWGCLVAFCLSVSLFSFASLFQSSLSKVQAKVTSEKYQPEQISDAVASSNKVVNATLASNINLTNLQVVLNNLPLERNWPIQGRITTYYSSYHPAIDIAQNYGTPIHPWASGIVTKVSYQAGGFGHYIVISHNAGYESTYAHLSTVLVNPGQTVGPNDVIGLVGATGDATGPHLHFQLSKDGRTFNPLSALP